MEVILTIAEGAVVYRISVLGIFSTAVEGITVRNRTTGNSINLARYTWSRDSLVGMGVSLASNWEFSDLVFTEGEEWIFREENTEHESRTIAGSVDGL